MCSHEEKYCPRCKVKFECKVGSILLCQCNTVSLTHEEIGHMQQLYNDCLCAQCMKEVRAEYHNNNLKKKIRKLNGIFTTD